MKPAGTFARSASASGAVPSDVARDRRLRRLLGGVVLVALLAVVALLLDAARRGGGHLAASAAPGPLSHAHVTAGLTCGSCHATEPAAASCSVCHAASAHRSRRVPHRALAAQVGGDLGCVDCHAQHDPPASAEPAPGASLAIEGTRATIWQGAIRHAVTLSAPAPAARLALVPRAVCARCHTPADPRDPGARCFPGGSTGSGYSSCFDEHGAGPPLAVLEAAGRALDGLGTAAAAPPPSFLSRLAGPELGVTAAGLLAGLVLTSWPLVRPRRRRARGSVTDPVAFPPRSSPAAPPIATPTRRLPIIDASRCLGCRACVDACAFDVLEVERFVAQVVRPDACCGAITCELACPNGSLTLVPVDGEGSRGGGPRPHLDASLESPDAPMVFLAGDLTGVPLIKHAIRQGRLVAEEVAAKLRGSARVPDVYDLVIVGAGPAGLSATLRARELGLSVLTLERGAVGASIRSFPRGKLVFERPLELPLEGELWMEECTKEELVAQWERVVRVHRLPVRAGHLVQSLEPLPGGARGERRGARYRVTALADDGSAPLVVSARALVLAVGTRGTPRLLPAPIDPAVEARVAYSLVDAASFAGRQILVVGLGDSAMEAALALARQPGCAVTLLARGERFTRGSARTLAELERAVASGQLTLHFGATVTRVTAVTANAAASTGPAAEAHVRFGAGAATGVTTVLPFDQMFVFIGGTAPWSLLAQAGVVIRGLA
jgi:thioredoxin reductase/NAD-dependent dihydropyrimidine dehydrogenase PreA subunit